MTLILSVMLSELKRICQRADFFLVMIISVYFYAAFYPQPYLNETVRNIPIVVVDQDSSTFSRDLIRRIDATDSISVAQFATDINAAKRLMLRRDVTGILFIPARFETNILAGQSSPIAFYGDGSYIMVYNYTASAIANVIIGIASEITTMRQIAHGQDAAVATIAAIPFQITSLPLFNTESGYATYVIPPSFVLILQQTLLLGALLLGTTKARGTQEEHVLESSGCNLFAAFQLVIGRALAYLSIYLIHAWVYLRVVPYLYDIPRLGALSDLFAIVVPYILSVSLLGIVISLMVKKTEAIFMLILPLSIPFFFLSGIPWLIDSPILAFINGFIPSSSGIEAIVRINQMGATILNVKTQFHHLWLLVILYTILATALMYLALKARKRAALLQLS